MIRGRGTALTGQRVSPVTKKKNARVSNRWGEGLDRAAYRVAGAMEREDLPAVVPELGQPIDSV
jgi:hypothetical protein